MKYLVAIAAILLASSPANAWPWGRYPSKSEASRACRDWAAKKEGMVRSRVTWEGGYTFVREDPIRGCGHERETRQFLGWDRPDAIPGKIREAGDPYPERKIKKKFRY